MEEYNFDYDLYWSDPELPTEETDEEREQRWHREHEAELWEDMNS